MADRVLLDRAGVARKLGVTVEWLYRNLGPLTIDGFPRPAFGRMSGARWDSAAIDRWLDAKLPPTGGPAPSGAGAADAWADALDARAADLAAAIGS